jgi:hypothetical protein
VVATNGRKIFLCTDLVQRGDVKDSDFFRWNLTERQFSETFQFALFGKYHVKSGAMTQCGSSCKTSGRVSTESFVTFAGEYAQKYSANLAIGLEFESSDSVMRHGNYHLHHFDRI